ADAGPDQTVTDTDDSGDEVVALDGSGSSDSDGTIVSYVWEENSTQIATGAQPDVTLDVGEHTIDLTVTDDDNATDTDSVVITITAGVNQAPIADAGPDQSVTDTDDTGDETVTLDGSASYDSDGTIVSYVWTEDTAQIATGVQPNVALAVGEHVIDLTVTDDDNATDTDTVIVTVDEGGGIIAFDAATCAADTSTASLSWTHTIGAGDDRLLVVGVENEDEVAADMVVSAVTYDGIAMTLVDGSQATVGSSTMNNTALYYLLDADLPAAGAYTVEVTYAGVNTRHCAGAISLANVAQQAAEAVATNADGSASSISTSITTLTDGAWVIDAVQSGHPSPVSVDAPYMLERYMTSGSGGQTGAGATQRVPTAGQATMAWDYEGADYARMAHSVAAFAPAPPGVPTLTVTETPDDHYTITAHDSADPQVEYWEIKVDIQSAGIYSFKDLTDAGDGQGGHNSYLNTDAYGRQCSLIFFDGRGGNVFTRRNSLDELSSHLTFDEAPDGSSFTITYAEGAYTNDFFHDWYDTGDDLALTPGDMWTTITLVITPPDADGTAWDWTISQENVSDHDLSSKIWAAEWIFMYIYDGIAKTADTEASFIDGPWDPYDPVSYGRWTIGSNTALGLTQGREFIVDRQSGLEGFTHGANFTIDSWAGFGYIRYASPYDMSTNLLQGDTRVQTGQMLINIPTQ
ncbi:MAG: PKD domain-containing protein, partial [Planctomycetota bacterium]